MEGITNEQIEKWNDEIKNGKTVSQIAKENNRAYNVIVKALRKNRKYRRLTQEERNEIQEMYKNGISINEIVKLKKIEISSIWLVLKKTIFNRKRRKITAYKKLISDLSESHLGYIAGIIDGEGCVMILKDGKRFRYTLSIANCDKKIIDYIHPIISYDTGKNKIHNFQRTTIRNDRKLSNVYELRISDKKILQILYAKLLPYVIGKKEEIELCLDAISNKNNNEKDFLLLKKIKHAKNKRVRLEKGD